MITWNESFFAGFTYVDMLVDGAKVYLSYSVEHFEAPKPNKFKMFGEDRFFANHQEARQYLIERYEAKLSSK